MDFLDQLENTLKALESRAGADPDEQRREQLAREATRTAALAIAPHAEALRNSSFVPALLNHCALIGHQLRTKVQMSWIETSLRLQARDRKLELRPSPQGIRAVFFENDRVVSDEPLDLGTDPEALAHRWLV